GCGPVLRRSFGHGCGDSWTRAPSRTAGADVPENRRPSHGPGPRTPQFDTRRARSRGGRRRTGRGAWTRTLHATDGHSGGPGVARSGTRRRVMIGPLRPTPPYSITTSRVLLRPWTPGDAVAVLAAIQGSREHLRDMTWA